MFHSWEFLHHPPQKYTDMNNRLGVKTRIFHLGDYRRATIPFGEDMPDDYFYVNGEYDITVYLVLCTDISV
jgi:hypothetical protein